MASDNKTTERDITLALERHDFPIIQHFQASEGLKDNSSDIFQLLTTMLLPSLYQGEQ